ncbi:MAG: hypothetical protein R3D63_07225 [Paracoccaceae bacterium]
MAEGDATDAVVLVRLNARLQPLNRGELFEDPLDEALQRAGLGSVSGGGSLTEPRGGIVHCELEIDLKAPDEAVLQRLVGALESLGAPKGSVLIDEDGEREIALGQTEGLALVLNGADLPAEVYAGNDVNALIAALEAALGNSLRYMDYWEGPAETSLYFYGDSFAAMQAAIAPVCAQSALCGLSRIEQIA